MIYISKRVSVERWGGSSKGSEIDDVGEMREHSEGQELSKGRGLERELPHKESRWNEDHKESPGRSDIHKRHRGGGARNTQGSEQRGGRRTSEHRNVHPEEERRARPAASNATERESRLKTQPCPVDLGARRSLVTLAKAVSVE